MKRLNVRKNIEKILNGEITIKYIAVVRQNILKQNLIEYKCKICKIDSWNNEKITLELDHINGDRYNNTYQNLRFLCPNCHSQTHNWKVKNTINQKPWIKEEIILEAIKQGGTIADIIRRVGLRIGGANYERIREIIKKYDIEWDEARAAVASVKGKHESSILSHPTI